ncbi:MAG TPA: hypothetical protein VGB17_03310, partial [Pyrinomonadaceae bacterium]
LAAGRIKGKARRRKGRGYEKAHELRDYVCGDKEKGGTLSRPFIELHNPALYLVDQILTGFIAQADIAWG